MCDFLNDIIEPKSPIVKVTFIDKEMVPETKYERGVIYDMRCQLGSGEEVIVEMQNRGQDFFKDRICYYMSRAISTQGERGDEDWNFQIHSVYGVFFMNFHLKDKETEKLHDIRHIALADLDTHEIFSEKMQLWLVELVRYRQMTETDCKTNKDYWLYILTHLETMNTDVPFQTQKPIFHKLENIADMAKLTRKEREHYRISLDSYRTNMAVMEHERNEGRAEGIAEGIAKGIAKGQLLAAKQLKESGALSIEQIAQTLSLPIEQVQSL